MHNNTSRFILFVFLSFFGLELEASVDRLRCMWRDNPSTTMVIGWDQISGSNPRLYYDNVNWGDDLSAYQFSQAPDRDVVAKGMNNHFVRLSQLQPNTIYYFVIKDTEGISHKYSFKTATDSSAERLSIIAGGDSRNYRKARRNANKLVAKLNPDCVMFGGDMTGGDTGPEWIDWFDDWKHTIRNGRLIPIIVTRGNHEYSNSTLFDLFDAPTKNLYYGLSLGGNLLRIYTLNSLIASGGDQKKWLENDLISNSNSIWKFAQYHYAIRPHTKSKSERNGQLKNWASLFHSYGVKLVMESDAHVVKVTYPVRPSRESGSEEGFIRDDENGTIYIGEGCWGAPIRRNNDNKSWTKASGSFNQFKWIFVDQNTVEIRTIKTDNADVVGFTNESDRFYPPVNLDIWSPDGEPVTYLNKKDVVFVKQNHSNNNRNRVTSKPMKLKDFNVAKTKESTNVISWKTINESTQKVVFEVQRSISGSGFMTFALVSSRGGYSETGENLYQIVDSKKEGVSYRLKEVKPNGVVLYHEAEYVVNSKEQEVLSPDPRTGLLKIKYNLGENGNVNIRLVDATKREISKSNYINQKSGNYLKSIDMSNMPQGKYLLIIKQNEQVIDRFEIDKKV